MSRPVTAGSVDEDYVQDMQEAYHDRMGQVAEEMRDMDLQEAEARVWDRVVMSLGLTTVAEVAKVADHVKILVDNEETRRVIATRVPTGRVQKGPVRGWESSKTLDNEVWITGVFNHADQEADGYCFWKLCRELGCDVPTNVTSPSMLDADTASLLSSYSDKKVLVVRDVLSVSHPQNHVQLVDSVKCFDWVDLACDNVPGGLMQVACLPLKSFLEPGKAAFVTRYYSHHSGEGFGGLVGGVPGLEPATSGPVAPAPSAGGPSNGRGRQGAGPESVRAESVAPGSTNVSGGVVRRPKRKVAAKSSYDFGGPLVSRNYNVATGVMFNNLSEVVLDSISADYAQEVLETLFEKWSLPTRSPEVMKYAEDLVFTFLIASTASDKADYNRAFDIPGLGGQEHEADFKVLSDLLVMKYGLTRRQLARGLADRLRAFARDDGNAELRAGMADRAGCQLQFADLAFDGSTHCKGLGPTERAFTKTLEARNLFEMDGVLAADASTKLLTGFNQRQAQRILGQ